MATSKTKLPSNPNASRAKPTTKSDRRKEIAQHEVEPRSRAKDVLDRLSVYEARQVLLEVLDAAPDTRPSAADIATRFAERGRSRRRHNVSPDDQRRPFQRDRDRILYSSAFRRLAGVTQVVSPSEGVLFHNRMIHSLKVGQIARRLAEQALDQDPTLAECLDPDVAEAKEVGCLPYRRTGFPICT